MKHTKAHKNGFSLIELTIVITLAGILIGSAMSFMASAQMKARAKATKDQFAALTEAIDAYVERFGTLPCPAPLTAKIGEANMGTATDCTDKSVVIGACDWNKGYCVQGGRLVEVDSNSKIPQKKPLRVRIGAVPTRAMSIPPDLAKDGWGQAITYAVTEVLAQSPHDFKRTDGGIEIIDDGGHTLITPPGIASYVLISHGSDGAGARSFGSGSQSSPCKNDQTADGENCDFEFSNKAVFRAAFLSQGQGKSHFDDDVYYKIKVGNSAGNGPPPCSDLPFCNAENIATAPVCQIRGGSDGLPLCTHRENVRGGPRPAGEYEHDLTTWRSACDWGDGWRKPSLAELRVVHQNRSDIGGFEMNGLYLSNSFHNPSIIENDDRNTIVWAKAFNTNSRSFDDGDEQALRLSPEDNKAARGFIRCVKR